MSSWPHVRGVRDSGWAPPARHGAARRHAARRAAVAVLSGLAAFVALQAGAAAALERWLPGAIDPDYGSRLARVREGRRTDPAHTCQVIMLGSSHTYYGLDADALGARLSRELGRPASVVNFGFSAGGPLTELLTWRRLRQDGVRPDLLLIEVTPAFMNDWYLDHEACEETKPTDRIRWLDVRAMRRYCPTVRRGLRREAALAGCNDLYSRRLGILHALAPELLPHTEGEQALVERLAPLPFPSEVREDAMERLRGLTRRDYGAALADWHAGVRAGAALRDLLCSCREMGVPAALVVTPEGPALRGCYTAEVHARIDAWLADVGREHGVPVIDAREWVPDEHDFIDSHHLFPGGAAAFTERLGKERVLPMLRRPQLASGPGR